MSPTVPCLSRYLLQLYVVNACRDSFKSPATRKFEHKYSNIWFTILYLSSEHVTNFTVTKRAARKNPTPRAPATVSYNRLDRLIDPTKVIKTRNHFRIKHAHFHINFQSISLSLTFISNWFLYNSDYGHVIRILPGIMLICNAQLAANIMKIGMRHSEIINQLWNEVGYTQKKNIYIAEPSAMTNRRPYRIVSYCVVLQQAHWVAERAMNT